MKIGTIMLTVSKSISKCFFVKFYVTENINKNLFQKYMIIHINGKTLNQQNKMLILSNKHGHPLFEPIGDPHLTLKIGDTDPF